MESLLLDFRYAARALLRSAGFTTVTVAILALGIGATTAVFSVVDGVLLRPLPFRDADRIVTLWQSSAASGDEKLEVSPANFLDWRDRARSFAGIAAMDPYGLDLTGRGEPASLRAWRVTEGFFQVMGAPPLLGRTLGPRDYAPGAERVVVLGHGLWRQRFGADAGVVGRTLTLDGEPTTVVGVMPPDFRYPAEHQEVWMPGAFDEGDRRRRGATYLQVVARLRPGVTAEQARAEMGAIAAQLALEHPRTNAEMGAGVVPLVEHLVGRVRPALLVLLCAVGLVLLIACANVAGLFLARAAGRRRELAIRAAIGAGRGRMVRQPAAEALLVALMGGVGGVLLASWGIDAIAALAPASLPGVEELAVDGRVLAFSFSASALAAVIFGLAPSLQASRPDLRHFLSEGSRGSPGPARARLRGALVVTETALALVLLIGAGLLARSFTGLLSVDPGFAPEGRATMQLFVYDRDPAQQVRFFEEVMEGIRALPGVRQVGAVSALPFSETDLSMDVSFTVAGRPEPAPGQEPSAYVSVAAPGYFEAMGIPLRRGRALGQADRPDAPPVALVNQTMARRHWPGEDPVGKRVRLRFERGDREVVGVVGDVRHAGLDAEPRPEVFLPLAQYPSGAMALVARTSGDPAALLPAMKARVWEINPVQTIHSTSTAEQLVAASLREKRFYLLLLGAFSGAALFLAAVGTYGLVSFTTRERTHEFGVRLALGETAASVVRSTVRQGVRLALLGAAAGLLGAVALTRSLRTLLYGVEPFDPATYAALAAVVVLAAAAAAWLPARRAARVDPMVALRSE